MLDCRRKPRNSFFLLLIFFCLALFLAFIAARDGYAAGLTFSGIKLNNAIALVNSPDPASNPDIPLNGNFVMTFSNTVQGYYDGTWRPTPYEVDNRDKVKLERIVDGARDEVGVRVEDGTPLTVVYSVYGDLIPGSQYVLTLQGDITANNNMNTLGADIEIGFTTVGPQKPAAPSFTSATLLEDVLTLSGLPSNATNLEYRISVDGTEDGYGAWSDLEVADQTATLTTAGLEAGTSRVEVRVRENPGTSTPAGDSAVQTVVQGTPPAPGAPAVEGAVLNGAQITLRGLPNNASNLEYGIAENGSDYSAWNDLAVAGTTAVIDAGGYDIDTGISKLRFRVKADAGTGAPAGDITEVPVVLALNVEISMQQGKSYVFENGLRLYADTLVGDAGDNTVTVSDAKNKTKPWEVAIRPASPAELGPVYGVLLKGPDDPGKKVILTVPIPYDVVPEQYLDKCSVYDGRIQTFPNGVDENGNIEPWTFLNDVDRSEMNDGIFKLTCGDDDFAADGKFHMYSVMYDYFPPDTTFVGTIKYAPDRDPSDPNVKWGMRIIEDSKDQGSGIGCWQIYRAEVNADSISDYVLIKTIGEIASYKRMSWRNGDFTYYDYDVAPGKIYSYKIKSYDPYGNTRGDAGGDPFSDTKMAIAMEPADIVQKAKADIESGALEFEFAEGDSRNHVTQAFSKWMFSKDEKYWNVVGLGNLDISWTCDSDLLYFYDARNVWVYMPLDADEAVVNLTGTIKSGTGGETPDEIPVVMATETVTVPITIKWTEEYTLCNGTGSKMEEQLLAAIARPDVKTIIFNFGFPMTGPAYVIDFQGKTVKAGPGYDEMEFKHPDSEGGVMFTNMADGDVIKNAKIDANGKKLQRVMYVYGAAEIENVEFTGTGRTKYAIMQNSQSSAAVRNCTFAPTERAGIFLYHFDHPTVGSQTIENCTFDGQGQPGYAILDQWGAATISNNVIKNYRGELTTGWNSGNDTPTTGISTYYTGLHDGFTSAGIFIRDNGKTDLHGNTITGCDSGIRVWTGEGYVYYKYVYDTTLPTGGYDALIGPATVYAKVNGVEITDQATAEEAAAALKLDNALSGNDWDIDICTAADPDNPVPLVRENYGPFSIYRQTPAPYAKGVAIDSAIEFYFTQEMQAGTINSSTVSLTKAGQAVAANVSYDAAENKVTLLPQANLGSGATYTVTVSTTVADKDGNVLPEAYSWSFSTKQFVVFYSPPAGAVSYEIDTDAGLALGFTSPIDPASISGGADVVLEQIGTLGNPAAGGAKVACGYQLNSDATELVIKPDRELANGGRYKITVPSKLTDKQGHALGADAGVEFYTKPAVIPDQFSVVLDEAGSPAVEKLQPGKRYVFSIQPVNMSDFYHQAARTYIVVRGGKGARLEHGGDILGKGYFNTGGQPNKPFGKEYVVFIVPEDITGNVYVDVMLRETTTARDNPRVLAKTRHFELPVNRGGV